MALADFLMNPNGADGFGPSVAIPQMALPDDSGIRDALARNAMLAQQRAQNPRGLKFGSPVRNFLGAIGDALLVATGGQPMYRQRLEDKRANSIIGQYLGRFDPTLAGMLGDGLDAKTAVDLFRLTHPKPDADPETIQLLKAAGIDPSTDEGKAIIRQKLSGSSNRPNFIEELDALGIDPRSPQALELFYGKNSPPGYLLRPPGEAGAPSAGLPTVNSQAEYDQLPPGSRYKDSQGNIGVKGGASPSNGSRDFR